MPKTYKNPPSPEISRDNRRRSNTVENESHVFNISPTTPISTNFKPQYHCDRRHKSKEQEKRAIDEAKTKQLEDDMQLALKLHAELNSSAESRKAARSAQKKISNTYFKDSSKSEERLERKWEKPQLSRPEKSIEAIADLRHSHTPKLSTTKRKSQASNVQTPNQDCVSSQDNHHVRRSEHLYSHLNTASFHKQSPSHKLNVKQSKTSTVEPIKDYVDETKEGDQATKQDPGFAIGDETTCEEEMTCCDSDTIGSSRSSRLEEEREHKDRINCNCRRQIDYGEAMICCDSCHTWQHNECMEIPSTEIDGDYLCHECDFRVICLIHLQDEEPDLYASNQSALKKYVLVWCEKGRTDVFEG